MNSVRDANNARGPRVQDMDHARGLDGVTASSGVAAVVDACYRASPKLWLSRIDLIDPDGDGKGHFIYDQPASGTIPLSEIHIACDINEGGLLDLQMTFNDGGGTWWLNRLKTAYGASTIRNGSHPIAVAKPPSQEACGQSHQGAKPVSRELSFPWPRWPARLGTEAPFYQTSRRGGRFRLASAGEARCADHTGSAPERQE
jgi:hypothetical protein